MFFVFLFVFKSLKIKSHDEWNAREFRSDTQSKRIHFPLDDKLNLIFFFCIFNI